MQSEQLSEPSPVLLKGYVSCKPIEIRFIPSAIHGFHEWLQHSLAFLMQGSEMINLNHDHQKSTCHNSELVDLNKHQTTLWGMQ